MAGRPYVPGRMIPPDPLPGVNSGSMEPPASRPGGILPAVLVARGMDAWFCNTKQAFRSDGTNQVWTLACPVFDLRPGLQDATGKMQAVVPINHEAALGLNVYLTWLIGSRAGQHPPALTIGLTAHYWEDGNNVDPATLYRLTQEIEITDTVLAGGTTIAAPSTPGGASLLQISPCQVGLRFWRPCIRLTIAGTTPITSDFFIQTGVH